MQLSWIDSPAALAGLAAEYVTDILAHNPTASIALPTGSTPLGLYQHLSKLHAAGKFSCDQARFFNLDDFVGKSIDDPQSYGAFLWHHVFRPLKVGRAQTRLLQGDAPDLALECRQFTAAIAAAGGLDLAILGLGTNGHVAFNEPGSDWDSDTRVVPLTAATRSAQQSLYAREEDVPANGLTMGLKTIRAARAVLLLVSGASKAQAMAALLRGRHDPAWPVTALLDHSNLTVLADRQLAPDLAQRSAYTL